MLELEHNGKKQNKSVDFGTSSSLP